MSLLDDLDITISPEAVVRFVKIHLEDRLNPVLPPPTLMSKDERDEINALIKEAKDISKFLRPGTVSIELKQGELLDLSRFLKNPANIVPINKGSTITKATQDWLEKANKFVNVRGLMSLDEDIGEDRKENTSDIVRLLSIVVLYKIINETYFKPKLAKCKTIRQLERLDDSVTHLLSVLSVIDLSGIEGDDDDDYGKYYSYNDLYKKLWRLLRFSGLTSTYPTRDDKSLLPHYDRIVSSTKITLKKKHKRSKRTKGETNWIGTLHTGHSNPFMYTRGTGPLIKLPDYYLIATHWPSRSKRVNFPIVKYKGEIVRFNTYMRSFPIIEHCLVFDIAWDLLTKKYGEPFMSQLFEVCQEVHESVSKRILENKGIGKYVSSALLGL